jgi:putative inorganic carbon (hco3(-)) transporter
MHRFSIDQLAFLLLNTVVAITHTNFTTGKQTMGLANNLNQNDKTDVLDIMATDSISAQRSNSRKKPLVGAYAALLLLMLIYFSRPEDWIPGLSTAPLAKITGVLVLLALLFSLRQIRQRLTREVLFLFLLAGQLFVASFLSPVWRGGAFQQTLNFAKVLLIVLVILATVTTSRRLRMLIFTQAVSVSAIASVTIWKRHLILGRLEGILGGSYSDPNDLALAIVVSLPLCLALLFLSRNRLWKILWSISMLVMIYAVFLTGSRGGFLALLVVATVFLWEFAIRGRRRYLFVLTALVGVIFWQSFGGILVGRFKGTFNIKEDTASAYVSAQARQQLLLRSIEVTKEHPLFGVGPGNFNAVSGQWHTTHNSLTLMSSEGGVPALIFYVLFLWCGFENLRATKRLVRKQTEASVMVRALFASLAGFGVGCLFLSVAYQFYPYILVAYTTALLSIARKSAAQSQKSESARQATREKEVFVDAPESEMSWHAS